MFFQSQSDSDLDVDNETMYFDNPSNLALATLNNVDGLNSSYVGLFNSQIKDDVWNSYFGKNSDHGKCFLCKNYIDRNASSVHMFKCAYYISCQNGEKVTPNNLKPVCKICHEKLDGRSLSEVLPEVREYFPKTTMNMNTPIHNPSPINWITNTTDMSMNVESNQHQFQTDQNKPNFSFAHNQSNEWNYNRINENMQNYDVAEVMDVL